MRLLSLNLQGQYKGLKDQTFNFNEAEGNIIAFIGLNGSGKSQLMELIAETFGYIESYFREDFRCPGWFKGLALEIRYQNQTYDSVAELVNYSVDIDFSGEIKITRNGDLIDLKAPTNYGIEEEVLPSNIIGYSSGQNENLQRPFMKAAVRYLDVMNAKKAWEKRSQEITSARNSIGSPITEFDLERFDQLLIDAYSYYSSRYSGLFPEIQEGASVSDLSDIGLRATELPRLKYLDQDTTALMLVSLGMVDVSEQKAIWKERQRFNKIDSVVIRYDLRKFTYDSGALLDVAKLVRSLGGVDSSNFSPLARVSRTSDELYDQFELDYLAGEISINFSDDAVKQTMLNNFFDPQTFFEKLYRLQLLGADYWLSETKSKLRQAGFSGSVRRPQKWKSPIQVVSLKLTDGNQIIEFDDLSDGEAQLIQVLSMAFIYKDSRTLFLLDEPETHLNPAWRTYFHSYIEDIISPENDNAQIFISTHSPFMVSSLKRKNVFHFKRDENGLIDMDAVQNETYGSSFDVVTKDLFELKSLISQSVIEEIRVQLKKGDEHAKEWIEENLGLSAERAYLLRKLSQ